MRPKLVIDYTVSDPDYTTVQLCREIHDFELECGREFWGSNAIVSMQRLNESLISATKAAKNMSKALDGLPKSPLQKIIECIRDTIVLLPILKT